MQIDVLKKREIERKRGYSNTNYPQVKDIMPHYKDKDFNRFFWLSHTLVETGLLLFLRFAFVCVEKGIFFFDLGLDVGVFCLVFLRCFYEIEKINRFR